MRPCIDHYPEGKKHHTLTGGCPLCEMDTPGHKNFSPAHHAVWNGLVLPENIIPIIRTSPKKEQRPLCIHLGESVGLVKCGTCPGSVKQKLFQCSAGHGTVIVTDCYRICNPGDYKAKEPS